MINMELRNGGKGRLKKAGKLVQKVPCKRSCIGKSATQLSLAKLASPHGFTLMSYLQRLFSELACPAVASHLNSGFPKPLAPTGAASQSYQLLPVADLLRLSSIFNIFSVLPPEQRLSGYTSENALKIAESLKSARRGT